MRELNLLVRSCVRDYAEPSASVAAADQEAPELRLHANEVPFNAPYNRHLDAEPLQLCAEMGRLRGLRSDCVYPGSSCEDLTDQIIRLFCEPRQDNLVTVSPTSPLFARRAALNGVECRSVPLGEDFALPVDALMAATDEHTKLILLCNPNNPTGTLFAWETIECLLETFEGMVVVDESFADFSRAESARRQIAKHPNLVVLESFSSAWGAAALRLAVAYAVPAVVAYLRRIGAPQPIGLPVLQQAQSLIKRRFEVDRWVNYLVEERNRMADAIKLLPICQKVYPSAANFLFLRVKDAAAVHAYLLEQGISVKHLGHLRYCQDCLRITVGLSNENARLLGALRKYAHP